MLYTSMLVALMFVDVEQKEIIPSDLGETVSCTSTNQTNDLKKMICILLYILVGIDFTTDGLF